MTRAPTPSPGGIPTPNQDGFYVPADNCRLARLWLSWPREPSLQQAMTALVRAVTDFAAISVIADPADARAAERVIAGAAEIVAIPVRSPRLRDTGPTFLVDGKGGASAVDWLFNGWGGRCDSLPEDRDFAHALLGAAEVRRFRAPLTLEPGAFVADGQDTLIALAPAVFDPARNPGITRLEAFGIFQQWLGVGRVIWVEAVHPDDALATSVRALAGFIAPGRVAVTAPMPDLPPVFAQTARDLAKVRDAHGNRLELIALPAPATGVGSYTEFLAVNGLVLVPAFGAASDDHACAILADAFVDREVRPLAADAFAAAGIGLASLAVPHPARLLERDRASVLPRSAWSRPPYDVDALLQKYIDLAAAEE